MRETNAIAWMGCRMILSNFRVIDLSHELHEKVPTWTGRRGFHSTVDLDYDKEGCRVMSYQSIAGVGTHMDAPSHFVAGAADISDIPIENLVVPLCVIKVSIGENSDYLVSTADIDQFENRNGPIPEQSLVVADTGWAQHWPSPERYRNMDNLGEMHFPGFHADAAEQLLQRGVVGVGLDTLSPDGGGAPFPVHHLMLGQGKYLVENLANLHLVPESGVWAVILPPKIHGGSEAPCRCIALVPDQLCSKS